MPSKIPYLTIQDFINNLQEKTAEQQLEYIDTIELTWHRENFKEYLRILSVIHTEIRLKYLCIIGRETITESEITMNMSTLMLVLKTLTDKDRLAFLHLLGFDWVNKNIQNQQQLENIIASLGREQRSLILIHIKPEVIIASLKSILSYIKFIEDLEPKDHLLFISQLKGCKFGLDKPFGPEYIPDFVASIKSIAARDLLLTNLKKIPEYEKIDKVKLSIADNIAILRFFLERISTQKYLFESIDLAKLLSILDSKPFDLLAAKEELRNWYGENIKQQDIDYGDAQARRLIKFLETLLNNMDNNILGCSSTVTIMQMESYLNSVVSDTSKLTLMYNSRWAPVQQECPQCDFVLRPGL